MFHNNNDKAIEQVIHKTLLYEQTKGIYEFRGRSGSFAAWPFITRPLGERDATSESSQEHRASREKRA